MRRAYQCALIALMLLIATKVCAQTESKNSSGSVAGRVTLEGRPLSGVTVMVAAGMSFQGQFAGRATTDEQGNYKVSGLAAGDYMISAFAPAFYLPSTAYGPSGKPLSLGDGETVEGLDLKLTMGGVIAGKITDSNGKPVVEERVQLVLVEENRQRMPMAAMSNPFNLMTDDRGMYRIYGLEPGRYRVSVGRDVRPGSIFPGGPPRFYPLTYYPGVGDDARAEIVELAPGGEAANIDIVLGKTVVGYSVRGRVINTDTGQPVAGVMVAYGSKRPDGNILGSGYSVNSQTDARGEFRIDGINPGTYAAFAMPMNDGDFYSDQGPFEITDGDVEGIQVPVHQGGSIAGIATVEGAGDPAVAARLSQLRLVARNIQTAPAFMSFSPKQVAPDGSFVLTGLSPGKTMISLANPNQSNGFSITRIELNGNDATGGIDVGAGQQITGVRIVMVYGAGVIRGRVKIEGGSLPETAMLRVAARIINATGMTPGQGAMVDSRGQFVIQGLADGEYDLTLMVYNTPPGPGLRQPLRQKVTVTQGVPAEAVFVLDLSGQK